MTTSDTSKTKYCKTLPTTTNVCTFKNNKQSRGKRPVLYAERTIKETSAKNLKKVLRKKRIGRASGVFHYPCAV